MPERRQVSDACQINDLNADNCINQNKKSVSDACQINDLNAYQSVYQTNVCVSDACQINDLNAPPLSEVHVWAFQMPVRSMT